MLVLPLLFSADFDRTQVPAPLETGAFELPTPQRATLDNGIEVVVVENHELPLFELRVVFNTGGWTDPEGQGGLAGASMDMLNEGAGGMDAVEISTATRTLGSSVWTSGGLDTSVVGCSGLTRNLEPTLDLWSTVLLRPDFPATEWDRLTVQYAQSLDEAASNPSSIAWTVTDRALYGEEYAGNDLTHESLETFTVDAMQTWYGQHIVPANAIILVGGDITLDEVVPLLNERLADWADSQGHTPPARVPATVEQTVIYVVDKPGASQSVVTVSVPVMGRTDDAWYPLYLGNRAWGGSFMARLNMNLREDKGWTYGARSWTTANDAPGVWHASSSIVADSTAPAVNEMLTMLKAVGGEEPLTTDELEYARSGLLNGYAARFETVDYLLDQQKDIWRYGLPDDWSTSWPANIQAVTTEDAQATFQSAVAAAPVMVVVVGDMETQRAPLEALGHPVVELDTHGYTLVEEN